MWKLFSVKNTLAIWRKSLKRFRLNRIHYIKIDCFYTLGRLRDSLLRDRSFFSFLTLLVWVVMMRWWVCLCYRRATFRFSSLVYGLYAHFRYMGRLVNNEQKFNFSMSFLHFCLPFGFIFIRMFSWESWNFKISVYQKSELCVQTINEWENRNGVLFSSVTQTNDELSTRNKKSNG